jgi:hypothetical protein
MSMGGPPARARGPARTDGKVLPFQALPQKDQQRRPRHLVFAISFNPPFNGADETVFSRGVLAGAGFSLHRRFVDLIAADTRVAHSLAYPLESGTPVRVLHPPSEGWAP